MTALSAAPRLLLVDNYDSFTWNLAQYLEELGGRVDVVLNDRIDPAGMRLAGHDGVVISPGPGRPEDAGISLELLRELDPAIPLLGVCLGHQVLARALGGRIVRATALMHGKTSVIHHDGSGVFAGLPAAFEATRYHSLVVDEPSLPTVLAINARTADGDVMGLRHLERPWHGVQFHPESILTHAGKRLLANFLAGVAGARVVARTRAKVFGTKPR